MLTKKRKKKTYWKIGTFVARLALLLKRNNSDWLDNGLLTWYVDQSTIKRYSKWKKQTGTNTEPNIQWMNGWMTPTGYSAGKHRRGKEQSHHPIPQQRVQRRLWEHGGRGVRYEKDGGGRCAGEASGGRKIIYIYIFIYSLSWLHLLNVFNRAYSRHVLLESLWNLFDGSEKKEKKWNRAVLDCGFRGSYASLEQENTEGN